MEYLLEFHADSVSEGILKTGWHLAKIQATLLNFKSDTWVFGHMTKEKLEKYSCDILISKKNQ